jgi:ribonuclease-3
MAESTTDTTALLPDLPPEQPAEVPRDLMERCEHRVGYTFRDKRLLRAAFTHASGAEHRLASNERLEFLGDSILGFVVCEMLFASSRSIWRGS